MSQPGAAQANLADGLTTSEQIPPQSPQLAEAELFISERRQEFMNQDLSKEYVDLPAELRPEYNDVLEYANRLMADAESKLPAAHVNFSPSQLELVERLISNVCFVQRQRQLLSSSSRPRYIISLENLKAKTKETERILKVFNTQVMQLADPAYVSIDDIGLWHRSGKEEGTSIKEEDIKGKEENTD